MYVHTMLALKNARPVSVTRRGVFFFWHFESSKSTIADDTPHIFGKGGASS